MNNELRKTWECTCALCVATSFIHTRAVTLKRWLIIKLRVVGNAQNGALALVCHAHLITRMNARLLSYYFELAKNAATIQGGATIQVNAVASLLILLSKVPTQSKPSW